MTRTTIAYLLLLLLFTACSRRQQHLPDSSAQPFEVLLVGDNADSLRRCLATTMPGLPQSEPDFDVHSIRRGAFHGSWRLARCIVVFDSVHRFSIRRDVYASPQIVIRTDGSCTDSLRNTIIKNELANEYRHLCLHHNRKAGKEIKRMFGFNALIPADLTASKQGKGFLWYSNNTAEAMRNIIVLKANDGSLAAVNRVLQANVPGETDDMFMQITSVADSSNGMWRGLWEMEHDAMGGPYVARHIGDIWILAFAYAPERKKRNIIRLLEAAVLSLGRSDCEEVKTK